MSRFWVCLLPVVILMLGLVLASRVWMNQDDGPVSPATEAVGAEPSDAELID